MQAGDVVQLEFMRRPILVTGGAGFIGSNFILEWLAHEQAPVINLDKLTYAGNLANLASVCNHKRYSFVKGDIGDISLVLELLKGRRPSSIVHFAAESHVDRSIHSADDFIRTNIEGTFRLLQAAREYWTGLANEEKPQFKFLHVSTDEVYGTLRENDPPFSEDTAYAPNSPYSASKAASDHLVRAFHHTYGLPTLTTNCSNNYGPFQFPEKLIPLMINNAIQGQSLPIYGDGLNIRDWLYVTDHCEAIRQVLRLGRTGETYNIGGNCEKSNIEVVREICKMLSQLRPDRDYDSLVTYVKDRPGHDRRYAVDCRKISSEIGWKPQYSFHDGLASTISWYLENREWVESVTSGAYQHWLDLHYATETAKSEA